MPVCGLNRVPQTGMWKSCPGPQNGTVVGNRVFIEVKNGNEATRLGPRPICLVSLYKGNNKQRQIRTEGRRREDTQGEDARVLGETQRQVKEH